MGLRDGTVQGSMRTWDTRVRAPASRLLNVAQGRSSLRRAGGRVAAGETLRLCLVSRVLVLQRTWEDFVCLLLRDRNTSSTVPSPSLRRHQ